MKRTFKVGDRVKYTAECIGLKYERFQRALSLKRGTVVFATGYIAVQWDVDAEYLNRSTNHSLIATWDIEHV